MLEPSWWLRRVPLVLVGAVHGLHVFSSKWVRGVQNWWRLRIKQSRLLFSAQLQRRVFATGTCWLWRRDFIFFSGVGFSFPALLVLLSTSFHKMLSVFHSSSATDFSNKCVIKSLLHNPPHRNYVAVLLYKVSSITCNIYFIWKIIVTQSWVTLHCIIWLIYVLISFIELCYLTNILLLSSCASCIYKI